MIIVGAGLAGLIAGHVFPGATIIERGPEPQQAHKALLRFRSDAVSLITGIPFRKVRVHKGIWSGNAFVQPDVRIANMYAMKGTGKALARSIWDISSVERWVAPDNLYQRMIEQCGSRIQWSTDVSGVTAIDGSVDPVVSTMPLDAAVRMFLGLNPSEQFKRAEVFVRRWRIHNADVHQTIYFPDPDTSTYRASITGDILIVESMNEETAYGPGTIMPIFGLNGLFAEPIDSGKLSQGKIAPINEPLRKELIHRLTTEQGVYSVGRYATWRNILLDDVVKDLRIVKGMMEQQDAYSNRLRSI